MSQPPTRAAQYVRMSTEHQRYSIEFQSAAIASYAAEHGLEVVRTYTDAGISGVTLDRREGLRTLLADVIAGQTEYSIVLVYDVSRWGRFQDPDQSAHYEFLCRQAGVRVEYCAEPFENDGSVSSAIVKQLKRAMAAEYSRELSVKVSAVQRGLARKGYRMAGAAGHGLRRMVVDEHGHNYGVLEDGERKGIQGYRAILIPGPPEEVAVVRRIFRMYAVFGMTMRAIAKTLNDQGVSAGRTHDWGERRIAHILRNENYIGVNVFGKRRRLTVGSARTEARDDWIRCEGAFDAIIDVSLFRKAQAIGAARTVVLNKAEMLDALRRLWAEQGFLSARLINDTPELPCVTIYNRRFGGLRNAYQAIGYNHYGALRDRLTDMSDDLMLEKLQGLKEARGKLTVNLINGAAGMPAACSYVARFGSMQDAYERIGYDPTGTGAGPPHRKDLKYTDRYMVAGLRELWRREGKLSAELINADPSIPSRFTYCRRFGRLSHVYRLIGYHRGSHETH